MKNCKSLGHPLLNVQQGNINLIFRKEGFTKTEKCVTWLITPSLGVIKVLKIFFKTWTSYAPA